MGLFSGKGRTVQDENAPMQPNKRAKIECTNIEMDKDGKGHIYFYFKSLDKSNPGTVRIPIWKQDPKDEKYDEGNKDVYVDQMLHIATAFISEDKALAIDKDDWVDYCKEIIKVIGNSYTGKECFGKLVNYKGRTSFPRYANFLSTEFAPRGFNYNPKYDNFDTLDVPDAPKEEVPSGGSEKKKKDLPF